MIPTAQAEDKIEILFKGGATETHYAPTLGYFENVLFPILQKMNYKIELEIRRRGYYPVGGSEVKAVIYPTKQFKPIKLIERGKLQKISGLSYASKHLEKAKVAERQAKIAEETLKRLNISIKIETKYFDTACPGCSIDLFAICENSVLGANSLGMRGKPAEKVGEEAAKDLIKQINSNACLDEHMADQILPYIAVARNSKVSVAEITNHVKTNIWIIEKFLPVKFEINEKNRVISC
jgi:RNA 3'-phosphate cyclase